MTDWHDELARDMAVRRANFAAVFAELKGLCLGPRPLGEDEAELLEELAAAQARMIAEWNAGDLLAQSLDAARASGSAGGRAVVDLERLAAESAERLRRAMDEAVLLGDVLLGRLRAGGDVR